VALILPAADFEDALAIANGVEHGLAATLYSSSAANGRRFSEAIEAGLVKLTPGPFAIDPSAPFGGWKASGLGPPEHGRWDREFYARPQALYGDS
jgi:alpha-ketoglutaric semialdehyde dehydrogenase